MEQGTKRTLRLGIFFIVALAGMFAAGLWLVWRLGPSAPAPHEGESAAENADGDVAVKTALDGGKKISSAASGYVLDVPADWYVEKNGGSGVAVYPGMPDASSSSPGCKIELSVFPAVGAEGDADWIGGHLAEDPTLDIAEISSDALTVSGDPAIRWDGTIDGAPTTLIYVFSPDHVYEVAPSSLNGVPTTSACAPYLDVFLENIKL